MSDELMAGQLERLHAQIQELTRLGQAKSAQLDQLLQEQVQATVALETQLAELLARSQELRQALDPLGEHLDGMLHEVQRRDDRLCSDHQDQLQAARGLFESLGLSLGRLAEMAPQVHLALQLESRTWCEHLERSQVASRQACQSTGEIANEFGQSLEALRARLEAGQHRALEASHSHHSAQGSFEEALLARIEQLTREARECRQNMSGSLARFQHGREHDRQHEDRQLRRCLEDELQQWLGEITVGLDGALGRLTELAPVPRGFADENLLQLTQSSRQLLDPVQHLEKAYRKARGWDLLDD